MIEFYLIMMALTAIHLWRLNRPTEAGGYLAFAGFIIAWPIVFAFAAFHAIARAIK